MIEEKIPCYSEQEHFTDAVEPEYIEDSDLSPHTKAITAVLYTKFDASYRAIDESGKLPGLERP